MKIITHWLIYAVAILITAYILPGVSLDGFVTALVLAIVLGAINLILRPFLIILTLPVTIVTVGIFVLIINAALVLLAAAIVPGFHVDSFWWALIFAIVLSIVSSFLHRLDKGADVWGEE